MKTGYCNLKIMKSCSLNQLTFAITKNTLEANEQWIQRILKDLDRNWPNVKTNDKVIIVSSKKNTLNGNATHCKNISDAWRLLSSKKNQFSVVFVCSNNTRLNDIYELVMLMQSLKQELVKPINMIHDEAHNTKEGIPAHRDIIENIILQPIVVSYMPCTASNNSLCCSDNPLWNKDNLEYNAIDYTDFDKTKSTDPNYSSVQEAKQLTFEELSKHVEWKDHKRTEVSREIFMKTTTEYLKKKINDLTTVELEDIDMRRKLEFCQFMKIQQEIKNL